MESMVSMENLFGGIYKDKRVLVTGHTGFKGSWMVLWLRQMGADVYGYALDEGSGLNHISLLNSPAKSTVGDIRVGEKLTAFVNQVQPHIVFHLAAQALVRQSYTDPVETYSTNVMGTLNVLEACRKTSSVRAIVNVTSDKCYANKEWIWGYRENDPMGGYDPYSSSKGCAELLASSYRNSFFNPDAYGSSHHVLLASARAGNVIGGGDWAKDRLIPDVVRAAAEKQPVSIRFPKATRPWQHVLEPLSGYLNLGWMLLEGRKEFADGWNFGPAASSNVTVGEVLEAAKSYWGNITAVYLENQNEHHEANLLMLDCMKAYKLLKWSPVWDINVTVQKTITWYKNFYIEGKIDTVQNIKEYVGDAVKQKNVWAC